MTEEGPLSLLNYEVYTGTLKLNVCIYEDFSEATRACLGCKMAHYVQKSVCARPKLS